MQQVVGFGKTRTLSSGALILARPTYRARANATRQREHRPHDAEDASVRAAILLARVGDARGQSISR
jgi:hypothetical protein